jgi:MFS family permease
LKLGKRESIASDQKSRTPQSLLNRGALPPAFIAFMLNFIWGSIAAFFPLYALKHGVSNPGIFFIFLAATLMLGRVFGGKILDVYDRKKVITFCLSIIIIALIILPLANSLGMFILIAVMLGTGWAFLYPFLTIHVIENAGLERGPAMGTFTALADLGAGLGPMLMGMVLEKFSYPVMFGCLIFTGVLNFFYFYWAIPKEK